MTDENGTLLESVNIYQDGSDSEGATEIRAWLENNYSTDPSTWDSSDYEARVRKLEAEGMTRSDAQAVADANTMNPTADCGHFKGCECWKTY